MSLGLLSCGASEKYFSSLLEVAHFTSFFGKAGSGVPGTGSGLSQLVFHQAIQLPLEKVSGPFRYASVCLKAQFFFIIYRKTLHLLMSRWETLLSA